MAALDAEYAGFGSGWSRVAVELAQQRLIAEEDVSRIRWLDAFGELIGNTDRHLGNISFYAESPAVPTAGLALAPAYDMLPMTFAPAEARTRPAAFRPRPLGAGEFEVWLSAARAASDYWERVAVSDRVSPGFREIAARAGEALEQLKASVRPQADW